MGLEMVDLPTFSFYLDLLEVVGKSEPKICEPTWWSKMAIYYGAITIRNKNCQQKTNPSPWDERNISTYIFAIHLVGKLVGIYSSHILSIRV